jgi:exodeoxyribonuclease VII large subunit
MNHAKSALEGVRLRVIGEVSEFSDKPGYKAAYFTVSDGSAAMPCMMWRDSYLASGIALRCGMLVEMSGHFSAYVPKGRMQFSVRTLEQAGEGRLRLQVAEMARRLEAEGLMSPARKRSLPSHPSAVGVVTSPRGKALHDVLRTLRRRYPLARVLIAGVQVEGDAAERCLIDGLAVAAASEADVVLLVRGGGSYEDLMPFNGESLARAIASCPVPVVTGIGHEPDRCIADMVADRSASTPTAAAEAVTPDVSDLRELLARDQRALAHALQHRVTRAAARLSLMVDRAVFTDPRTIVAGQLQSLDLLGMRLGRALPDSLSRASDRLALARGRLTRVGPLVIERIAASIAVSASRIETLSPLAVLARGYSATFAADGRTVVNRVEQVSPGDRIVVRVTDGRIGCVVDEVEGEDS